MSNVLETLSEQELIQRKNNLLYQLERIENQLKKLAYNNVEVIYDEVEIDKKTQLPSKITIKLKKKEPDPNSNNQSLSNETPLKIKNITVCIKKK